MSKIIVYSSRLCAFAVKFLTAKTQGRKVNLAAITFAIVISSAFVEVNFSVYKIDQQDSTKGLKDFYQKYFPIGVAVSPGSLKGDEEKLILKEFNSLTAENVLKPGPIHPEETRYNWAPADEIVNFAQANNLKMRGHTLVWHNQTPDWFFKNENGGNATKEILLQRLKDHGPRHAKGRSPDSWSWPPRTLGCERTLT